MTARLRKLVFAWVPGDHHDTVGNIAVILLFAAYGLGGRGRAFLADPDFNALFPALYAVLTPALILVIVFSTLTRVEWDEDGIVVRTVFGRKSFRWENLHGLRTPRFRHGPLKNVLILYIDRPFAMPLLDPMVKRRRSIWIHAPARERAQIERLYYSRQKNGQAPGAISRERDPVIRKRGSLRDDSARRIDSRCASTKIRLPTG